MELFDPANYSLTVLSVPVFVTALAVMVLGVVVLVREQISRVSVSFFMLTVALGVWLFAFASLYSVSNVSAAQIWVKMAYVAVPCIPSAIYLFTVLLLRIYRRHRATVLLSWAASALFVSSAVGTDALLGGLHHYSWGFYPQYGWLGAPFITFFFGMFITSMILCWRSYRREPAGESRQRTKLLMIALAIAHIGSVDYIAKYGISLYPFGYLAVFGFVVLTARIIWTYRLAEITPAFAARQIVDTISDALFVLDRDGVIRVVNPAACFLFSCTKEELIGKAIATKLDGTFSSAQLDTLLETRVLQNHEIDYEAGEGKICTLSLSASVMKDQDGTPTAIVCVARDITESKRAEDAHRSAREMRALYDISLLISSCLTVDEVIERIGACIDTLIYPDSYYIALFDAPSESIEFQFYTIMEPGEKRSNHSIKLTKPLSEGGLTAYIIKTRQPALIRDTFAESSAIEAKLDSVGLKPIITAGVRMKSILSVPMVWQDKVIGVISAQCVRPDALDTRDQRLFEALAAQTSIALENARLHKLAQDQAQLDSLTQVYNHGHFVQLLNQAVDTARKTATPISLIMLDVDHFKRYNDTYGHIVGDTVLRMVAGALKASARDMDCVGRWGGEEFGLLISGAELAAATRVARRVRRAIAELIVLDGQGNLIPSPMISQGVSTYPFPASNSTNLIEQADAALYYAKEKGRNKIIVAEDHGVLSTVPLVSAPLQFTK